MAETADRLGRQASIARWNASEHGLRLCVDPLGGESVPGFVVRSLANDGRPAVAASLSAFGINRPRLVALTSPTCVEAGKLDVVLGSATGTIASLAGEGVRELAGRATHFDANGTRVPAGHCDRRRRRFSAAALRASPHHRTAWLLKTAPFCPETLELLSHTCPDCLKDLGWTRTLGVVHCEWCSRAGIPLVDLRDAPPAPAPISDEDAAMFFSGLISHDALHRERSRAALPQSLRHLASGDVYGILASLYQLRQRIDHDVGDRSAIGTVTGNWSVKDVELCARDILEWPRSIERLAERCRADAEHRPGAGGIVRELGPLLDAARSTWLSAASRSAVRSAVDAAILASCGNPVGIARFGKAPQHPEYQTVGAAAAALSLPRRTVIRMAAVANAEVVNFIRQTRTRRKIAVRDTRRMSALLSDAMPAAEVAARLGLIAGTVSVAARILGIAPVAPEVGAIAGGRRLFGRASAEAFSARIQAVTEPPDSFPALAVRASASSMPYFPAGAALLLDLVAGGHVRACTIARTGRIVDDVAVPEGGVAEHLRARWLAMVGEGCPDPLIDAVTACQYLSCSLVTFYQIVSEGLLPQGGKRRPSYTAEAVASFRADWCTIAEAALLMRVPAVTAWRRCSKAPGQVIRLKGGVHLIRRGILSKLDET